MKAPMEDIQAMVLLWPANTGHSGTASPKSFLCLPKFCFAQKNLF